MKPLLSFFSVLILFQSLIIGNLVKHELTHLYPDKWEETLLHKQTVLDPFLLPDKGGVHQNLQSKNHWLPFQFNNPFTTRSGSSLSILSEIPYHLKVRNNYPAIPVYLFNGILRL